MNTDNTDNSDVNSDFDSIKDQLQSIIERVETLNDEKQEIMDARKEVFAEAKGNGFDGKAIRKIIALRKMNKADILEEEMLLETYKSALGMI